jgi:hypothetical protein
MYWTIRLNTYSPGLVTSLLYLVIFYVLIRYHNLVEVLRVIVDDFIGSEVTLPSFGAAS